MLFASYEHFDGAVDALEPTSRQPYVIYCKVLLELFFEVDFKSIEHIDLFEPRAATEVFKDSPHGAIETLACQVANVVVFDFAELVEHLLDLLIFLADFFDLIPPLTKLRLNLLFEVEKTLFVDFDGLLEGLAYDQRGVVFGFVPKTADSDIELRVRVKQLFKADCTVVPSFFID